MKLLNIYTDGACSNNQSDENAGGWGAILEYGDSRKEMYGGEADTTNNRMEMTALIEALSALKRDGLTIRVFSDSTYLMSCFRNRWYVSWEKKGWRTSANTPVKNKELWTQLLSLTGKHNISYYIVKGHVNVNKDEALRKEYGRFREKNGQEFSFDEFVYITKMNNRADELANIGMEPYRR